MFAAPFADGCGASGNPADSVENGYARTSYDSFGSLDGSDGILGADVVIQFSRLLDLNPAATTERTWIWTIPAGSDYSYQLSAMNQVQVDWVATPYARGALMTNKVASSVTGARIMPPTPIVSVVVGDHRDDEIA